MSLDPQIAAYDALAPHFEELAASRAPYLEAVERLVIDGAPEHPAAMLDVGSGDGRRAVRIARATGARSLVLVEPSPAMAAECRRRDPAELWRVPAQHLPIHPGRFDVITCLWNVLGHVPTPAERVESLRRMRALLSRTGLLFLDVNHRYNTRAYGRLPTLFRWLHDTLRPRPENGDVRFRWNVDGREISCTGHVFTMGELTRLFAAAGLDVVRRHVVDYATGDVRRSALSGQLLFALRASGDAARVDR